MYDTADDCFTAFFKCKPLKTNLTVHNFLLSQWVEVPTIYTKTDLESYIGNLGIFFYLQMETNTIIKVIPIIKFEYWNPLPKFYLFIYLFVLFETQYIKNNLHIHGGEEKG